MSFAYFLSEGSHQSGIEQLLRSFLQIQLLQIARVILIQLRSDRSGLLLLLLTSELFLEGGYSLVSFLISGLLFRRYRHMPFRSEGLIWAQYLCEEDSCVHNFTLHIMELPHPQISEELLQGEFLLL